MTKDVHVVVGGASGIGEAVADRARGAGETVVVWDCVAPHDVECDVRDPDTIDGAMARTIDSVGLPARVTITAGVGRSAMLLDETVDAWDRVMAVNTRGSWLVMRAVARPWIDAGVRGSIVATSSVSAHLADAGMGTYCASKAALGAVVRVAAVEWAGHGIRVNAVGPGVTETPMLGRAPTDSGWLADVQRRTPLGRLGTAADVATAIALLHDAEWVTGQILDCDGGLALHSPINPFDI